jgi:hypothetical protein
VVRAQPAAFSARFLADRQPYRRAQNEVSTSIMSRTRSPVTSPSSTTAADPKIEAVDLLDMRQGQREAAHVVGVSHGGSSRIARSACPEVKRLGADRGQYRDRDLHRQIIAAG